MATGKVALHGPSAENPGILECFELVEELKRAKAGSGPPPAVAPEGAGAYGSSAPGPDGSPEKKLSAEASMLAQLVSEDASAVSKISPEHHAVILAAQQDLDRITVCANAEAATEAVKRHAGQRITVLIDLPTSRKALISQAIALGGKMRSYTAPEKFRMIVNVQRRYDLFEAVQQKVSQVFQVSPNLVTVAKTDTQTKTYKPSYIFATAGIDNKTPTVIKVGNMSKHEKLGYKCKERNCRHRPVVERSALGESPVHVTEEIDPQDMEVDIVKLAMEQYAAEMAEQQEDDCDKVADDLALMATGAEQPPSSQDEEGDKEKKQYICEVYAFTNSASSYEGIFDKVGGAPTIDCILVISGTTHPASWYAAKQSASRAVILMERATHHSLSHGRELMLSYLIKARLRGAAAPLRSMLLSPTESLKCIHVPKVPLAHQLISAYEVSSGDKWCDGLNKVHWEADALSELVAHQVEHDLSLGDVTITAADEKSGRGLVAARGIREEEVICEAPALWCDSEDKAKTLLRQHNFFADRTVRVRGVRTAEDTLTDIYGALAGVAQYAQHYVNQTKAPNARFQWTSAQGFNSPSLALVACTPRNGGISKGSRITVNYGVDFDLFPDAPGAPALLKTSLESIFKKQLELQKQEQEEQAPQTPQPPQPPQARTPEAEAAGEAETLKRKAEEEAAANEAAKKRKLEEAARAAGAAGADSAGGAGARKTIEVYTAPPAELHLAGEKLVLTSSSPSNKKFPPSFTYKMWCSGSFVKAAEAPAGTPTLPWEVTPTTVVYSSETKKLLPAKKLIKDHFPEATSFFGYAPWLIREAPSAWKVKQPYQYAPGHDDNELLPVSAAAKTLSDTALAWVVKYDRTKGQLYPSHIGLFNVKQFSLQAGAEMTLA